MSGGTEDTLPVNDELTDAVPYRLECLMQYVIPMLGMLLGNCTSGVSLGLTTILEELTTRRDSIGEGRV